MHVALLDALRADHVREQLKRKRWILDEIESAVSDPDILELIEQGEFADVADNLVLLGLVLDPRACQCLRTLISDFPRSPSSAWLRPGPATNESRYLTLPDQLDKVAVPGGTRLVVENLEAWRRRPRPRADSIGLT
jgi:hypothetical protein